ncbi:hypothetical protein K470DRAFT_265576 [Piedraia hortae CBS 480.64]|uniref:Uncharacterized protein n=1 Tax=Piedraia hortae CBS 480.64 TaxID=1314780 RepID=A0A6A7BVG1_9PEZI|nr:hypothetical protein K470DRAFT_265576 [Piedraia hortae CBS 480.64]
MKDYFDDPTRGPMANRRLKKMEQGDPPFHEYLSELEQTLQSSDYAGAPDSVLCYNLDCKFQPNKPPRKDDAALVRHCLNVDASTQQSNKKYGVSLPPTPCPVFHPTAANPPVQALARPSSSDLITSRGKPIPAVDLLRFWLLMHAKLFAVAVKYQYPYLEKAAIWEFRDDARWIWSHNSFAEAISFVYNSTPDPLNWTPRGRDRHHKGCPQQTRHQTCCERDPGSGVWSFVQSYTSCAGNDCLLPSFPKLWVSA